MPDLRQAGEEIVIVLHDLNILFHAEIVEREKCGRYVVYRLRDGLLVTRSSPYGKDHIDLGCCRLEAPTDRRGDTTDEESPAGFLSLLLVPTTFQQLSSRRPTATCSVKSWPSGKIESAPNRSHNGCTRTSRYSLDDEVAHSHGCLSGSWKSLRSDLSPTRMMRLSPKTR